MKLSNRSAIYQKPLINDTSYLLSPSKRVTRSSREANGKKTPLLRNKAQSKVDSWNLNYRPRPWKTFIMSYKSNRKISKRWNFCTSLETCTKFTTKKATIKAHFSAVIWAPEVENSFSKGWPECKSVNILVLHYVKSRALYLLHGFWKGGLRFN